MSFQVNTEISFNREHLSSVFVTCNRNRKWIILLFQRRCTCCVQLHARDNFSNTSYDKAAYGEPKRGGGEELRTLQYCIVIKTFHQMCIIVARVSKNKLPKRSSTDSTGLFLNITQYLKDITGNSAYDFN